MLERINFVVETNLKRIKTFETFLETKLLLSSLIFYNDEKLKRNVLFFSSLYENFKWRIFLKKLHLIKY